MNFGLKDALVYSAVLHAGFLAVRLPMVSDPLREMLSSAEAPYVDVMLEPEPDPAPGPASPSREAGKKPSETRAAPPPPAPRRAAQVRAEPLKGREPQPQKRVEPPPSAPAPVPPPPPETRAALLPDGEIAALQHKELVREYLRKRLHYPAALPPGTVRLRVSLSADGTLRAASVTGATDPRLASCALHDARAAGSYPRFPREMGSSQAEYEFLVQYRPDGSSL